MTRVFEDLIARGNENQSPLVWFVGCSRSARLVYEMNLYSQKLLISIARTVQPVVIKLLNVIQR